MTVERLRIETTPLGIARWQAYNRIEPIGEYRADLRAALMTMHIVAVALTKAGREKLKLSDFLLDFTPKPETSEPDSDAKVAATVRFMMQCFGNADGNTD